MVFLLLEVLKVDLFGQPFLKLQRAEWLLHISSLVYVVQDVFNNEMWYFVDIFYMLNCGIDCK